MKLVLAIINNDDSATLISELMRAKFSATKLSSTGGFLQAGNTTLLIGVEDERLEELKGIIELYCKKRKQIAAPVPVFGEVFFSSAPVEVIVGGATVFVLDLDSFEKL